MLGLTVLQGCAQMRPEDFKDTRPVFRIEEYFQGKTRAWGLVQGRSGEVKRQFVVDIVGQWEGDEFVLRETFEFSDGERSERVWRIRKTGEHAYEGRAGDVVGFAKGSAYGQALNWQYDLLIEAGGSTWKIHFDDWMFLQRDDVLINRATMSKFGIKVGEVLLFFRREGT